MKTDRAQAIESTFREICAHGAVLCIRFGPGIPVVEAARAAAGGGLRILEITLTTPGALEAIRLLARDETILAGAGTVLTINDVRETAGAGARFIMSPVFDKDVVDEAHRHEMLAIPGAASPGEILAAHRSGARMVKFYPSGALGGPAFLRAIRGPLPDIPIIPTSGPTAENLAEYFAAGAAAVGVGSDVFPEGFALESVEAAARRVRSAIDAYRSRSGA
ncbi:MAG: bifunctional 4-hydroxy-2-oxoglutarate aldolase/2-dehydro-3-deoxy-phosphogluconate aldolase [Chitinivibrionia bacterium]|nr:bifunctional 4-hydroxy-2-oxoglutarate aldolase/2-dehydro-3-deoxy-phosphogluconate aldolase [Chitinivibrionia bacterium]